MNSFEPLKVTAHLRTSVVSDRWLPLDSILMYQACRDKLGPQITTIPGGASVPDVELPLKKIHADKPYWYYACSWAQPQPWWLAEGKDYWNKRFDSQFANLVDFKGRRGKVLIEQGRYKAYHMPIFYRVAIKVDWYCVGDGEEIERLLSIVTHIGKKRAYGWGRVIRWDVEPWPHDWSVVQRGKLTRGVPINDVGEIETFNMVHYGLRPGYYQKENQMMLAMP